ncbi:MAG: hypothetical protein LC723_13450 [Actinobacteria bacterium]|nr:hypothetical protein [Actinomycetota bacterium]
MNNYIPDQNPYNLAGPPQHWLARLWDFDPALVVLPSRQECVYRLAQRARPKLSEQVARDILKEQADTRMLAAYGLVPVTTILATANWSGEAMWLDLAQRAPWRQGGAEKVIKVIEDAEYEKHIRELRAEEERLTNISKEGYKAFKYKAGKTSRNAPLTW